jgi:hypothetical protein
MDWLDSDHVGTPTDTHVTIELFFSRSVPKVYKRHGRSLAQAKPDTGNTRDLNLAAVKHTTVQVSRLPL